MFSFEEIVPLCTQFLHKGIDLRHKKKKEKEQKVGPVSRLLLGQSVLLTMFYSCE